MVIVTFILCAFSSGCAKRAETAELPSPECQALWQTVANQESTFVKRVKDIRSQHLLMREYDQRMIDAITERRDALQSTTLMGMSVSTEIAGCKGKQLEDMQRNAQRQMVDLRVYLGTFKQALKFDPPDTYIDQ